MIRNTENCDLAYQFEILAQRLLKLEMQKRWPWVTAREAEIEYRISRTSFWRKRKSGEIRAFKYRNKICCLRKYVEPIINQTA